MLNPIAIDEYRKVRQLELELELKQDRLARAVRKNAQSSSKKPRLILALGSLTLSMLVIAHIFVS
jgi:hypothetical protein